MKATEKWKEDEPFSARPASLGSFIAGFANEDHDKAIQFARDGLVANPGNPGLLNNLAFSLACRDRTDEASEIIRAIDFGNVPPEQAVAITATIGLIAFRVGKPDEGRAKYLEAMELARKKGLAFHLPFAALHLVREEVRANPSLAQEAIQHAEELAKNSNHPCIRLAAEKLNQDLAAAGISPIHMEVKQDWRGVTK